MGLVSHYIYVLLIFKRTEGITQSRCTMGQNLGTITKFFLALWVIKSPVASRLSCSLPLGCPTMNSQLPWSEDTQEIHQVEISSPLNSQQGLATSMEESHPWSRSSSLHMTADIDGQHLNFTLSDTLNQNHPNEMLPEIWHSKPA